MENSNKGLLRPGALVDKDADFETDLISPGASYRNGLVSSGQRSFERSINNDAEISRILDEPEQQQQPGCCQACRNLPKRSLLTLCLCCMGSFCDGCTFSLMAPFFPTEAEKKGVSLTVVGFIFAVFELVFFLFSPVFGGYIKKIGPKRLYVSGIFIGGVCVVVFGFLDKSPAGATFTALCFVLRIIIALGMCAFLTAGFAILSHEFSQNVATIFGIIQTCEAVGMMAGPAIGGALYEYGGFGMPFWVVGGFIILVCAVICVSLPHPQSHESQSKITVRGVFRNPVVPVCYICVTVVAMGLSFLEPTMAHHLSSFHLSGHIVGLIFCIAPFVHGVCTPFWGWVSDKKGVQSPLIVVGNLVCCIAMLTIGPCPLLTFIPFTLKTVIIGLALFGLSFGCVLVASINCILHGAWALGYENNIDTYGAVSGIFHSAFCLGAFIGPILGGALVQYVGFPIAASIVAICNLVMLVVTLPFFVCRRVIMKNRSLQRELLDDNSEVEVQRPDLTLSSDGGNLSLGLEGGDNTLSDEAHISIYG